MCVMVKCRDRHCFSGQVVPLNSFFKGSHYIHFLLIIILPSYCIAWIPVFTKKATMNLHMQDTNAPVPIAIDKKIVGLGVGAVSYLGTLPFFTLFQV